MSGLPIPPPGDLPDPGIEPTSPASLADFFNARATFDLYLSFNGDSLKSPGVEAAF